MTQRAAIYTRISEDPLATAKGVERQREDAEALIAARGWTLVEVYTDNDITALRGKSRPAYAAMMAAVGRGEFDQIVAYGLSRIWRNRSERAAGIDLLKNSGVGVALVKGSDIDMTSASGRMMAGILGEVDTAESEVKSERVARAAQQRAQEGRANGAVAYGWRREQQRDPSGRVVHWHDVEDAEQADVVRGIVADLLAGRTLNAITRELNERGVSTPLGRGAWLSSSVKKLALRDLNVALRTHRGVVVGPAASPAIIPQEDHDRVKALFAEPGRGHKKGGARRHLLSFGIGECGKCGSRLRVMTRGGHAMYACDTSAGCTGRRQTWVDELVTETVCARLARPDARDLFARDDTEAREARTTADAIRARMDSAADAFAEGAIDARQLARITARLQPELEAAEKAAMTSIDSVGPALLARFGGPDARAVWDGLELTQRRAVLTALGVRVILVPGLRGGAGFKPESVRIEPWQSGDSEPLPDR